MLLACYVLSEHSFAFQENCNDTDYFRDCGFSDSPRQCFQPFASRSHRAASGGSYNRAEQHDAGPVVEISSSLLVEVSPSALLARAIRPLALQVVKARRRGTRAAARQGPPLAVRLCRCTRVNLAPRRRHSARRLRISQGLSRCQQAIALLADHGRRAFLPKSLILFFGPPNSAQVRLTLGVTRNDAQATVAESA